MTNAACHRCIRAVSRLLKTITMAYSSQALVLALLFCFVTISATPVHPDTQLQDSRQPRAKRTIFAEIPSRKQTEYEIGILQGYLNNHELYFCRGDPYQGIQCPEEPQCATWDGICDGTQVCAVKYREMCLNRSRESYGHTDDRLCNGDENKKWCYWKNLAPARCGEDIFLDPNKKRRYANIRSPGYPKHKYPSDLFCFWTVRVPRGRRLSVRVRRFNSEFNYDYLSIGHGSVRDDPRNTVVFKHSGDKLPKQREFNSRSNSVWITFRADDWDGKEGFTIRVQDMQVFDAGVIGQNPFNAEPNSNCGESLFFEPGEVLTLTSPNYPDLYDDYIECVWIVSTTPGRIMQVTFAEFNTEVGEDFLSVGNGVSTRRGPIIYKYSGEKPPKKIVSRSSNVWFKFSSSLAIARVGFRALIKERPHTACGGTYIVPSEGALHIASPSYPISYHSNMHCFWNIRSDAERSLYIVFNDFQSEWNFDRLYLGTGVGPDVNRTNVVINRHTGNRLPDLNEFLLRYTEVWIKFATDELTNLRGFDMIIYDELVAPRTADEFIVVEEEEEVVEVLPSEEPSEDVEEAPSEPDEVAESSYRSSSSQSA